MISALDQLIENVDSIILLFVQNTFNSLSPSIEIFWKTMFIIFIAVFGYKVIISGRFSANELLLNILKIIIILAVATQWDTFFILVYNLVTDLPADIAGHIIINVSQSLNNNTINNINDANMGLSLFYDRSVAVTETVLEGASWNDFGIFLYAGAIALCSLLFSSYAAMLIILAKIAVAVMLALGPVFILLLIFKNTQNLFEGWLRALLNFSLIPIFIYSIIAFFLILAESPLRNLEDNADINSELLSACAPFLLITVIGFMILSQIMNMASTITGGLSLATMGVSAWSTRKATSMANKSPKVITKGSVLLHAGIAHPVQSAKTAKSAIVQTIKNIRGF